MTIRKIPIGDEGKVSASSAGKQQKDPTVPDRVILSEILGEIEEDKDEQGLDNSRANAIASLNEEDFQTAELDPFTQDVVTGGTQPAFSVKSQPVQLGSITTPFLGTTPIFSGQGLLLQRERRLQRAANKASSFKPPSIKDFETAPQFLRNYRGVASRRMKGVVDKEFELFKNLGLNASQVQAVLGNPGSDSSRRIDDARSGLDTLGEELANLDEIGDEIEEKARSLDITTGKETAEFIRRIRTGDSKFIDLAEEGKLGPVLKQLNTQASIVSILNKIRPNIELDVETADVEQFFVQGIPEAKFVKQAAKAVLTDSTLDALIRLSGEEDVIEEYGRDRFKRDIRELQEKKLREQWRIINESPKWNINLPSPPKDVTRVPLSIQERVTSLGVASKQLTSPNGLENGVTQESIATNSGGDKLINGEGFITTIIGGQTTTVSKKDPIGMRNALIEYYKPTLGIGKGQFEQSDVEGAFESQGITKQLNSLLSSATTEADRKKLNSLSNNINKEGGVNKARIESVAELTIRKQGFIDLGNNRTATSIIKHDVDANGDVIRGYNFKTNTGESGIAVPAKTWRVTVEKTGFLPSTLDIFKEKGTLIIGDETVWLRDDMFIIGEDAKGDPVWILAEENGRIVDDGAGHRLEFPTKAIESPIRNSIKKLNRIATLPATKTKRTGQTPLETGRFIKGATGETTALEPGEAPPKVKSDFTNVQQATSPDGSTIQIGVKDGKWFNVKTGEEIK